MYLPVSVCVPVWLLFTVPFFLSIFHLFIFSWHHNFSCISHFLNFPSLSVSQFPSLPLMSVSFRYLFPLSPLPGFLSFHFFRPIPSVSLLFPIIILSFLTSFSHLSLLPAFSSFLLHSSPCHSFSLTWFTATFSFMFSLSSSPSSCLSSTVIIFNHLPILSLFISVSFSNVSLLFSFITFSLPPRPSPCLPRSHTYSFLICVRASPLTEMFPSLMWT